MCNESLPFGSDTNMEQQIVHSYAKTHNRYAVLHNY